MNVDPWCVAFWVSIVSGLAWSISRELHIRTLSGAAREIAENQAKATRVLKTIIRKIDASDNVTRAAFADVKQLILDVEDRETNRRIEVEINKSRFGTKIDISGNVNQAGGRIENEH